ncbi:hypothetical protein [Qipengyuania marisflavi]|uniref:Uncharacterized protein n=1 Tax=Qipengyuania marisflavi TaxID=2486356 RepID=A0A5S3P9T5_9SPHN|nr:hypothetical protein [Qipengyuania marisflavi]TMM50208.1 hypothetical protein FEV51_03220 [Qipengyuania marisflavi]
MTIIEAYLAVAVMFAGGWLALFLSGRKRYAIAASLSLTFLGLLPFFGILEVFGVWWERVTVISIYAIPTIAISLLALGLTIYFSADRRTT